MTTHSGPILAQRDNLTVIDCHVCGYQHLTQFPTEAELAEFYASDFWQKDKAGALAEFERAAEWWAMTHGDWLECVEAHASGRTLLDVGCGYGFFLKSAIERAWRVTGLDPSEDAIYYCLEEHGLKPYSANFILRSWERDMEPEPEFFDCISAHWLIEHIPNPLDFLLWCKSHLAPGGVLLAVIPQEWTEAQAAANEIVKKKAWHLDATHINYFSQTSFSNLLGRAGFRIVDMLASFQMERYITEFGTNYVDLPYLGSLAHRAVEQIELAQTREVRIAEARERARYGKGRDLVCICRKD